MASGLSRAWIPEGWIDRREVHYGIDFDLKEVLAILSNYISVCCHFGAANARSPLETPRARDAACLVRACACCFVVTSWVSWLGSWFVIRALEGAVK
jgi:hypothetical protein